MDRMGPVMCSPSSIFVVLVYVQQIGAVSSTSKTCITNSTSCQDLVMMPNAILVCVHRDSEARIKDIISALQDINAQQQAAQARSADELASAMRACSAATPAMSTAPLDTHTLIIAALAQQEGKVVASGPIEQLVLSQLASASGTTESRDKQLRLPADGSRLTAAESDALCAGLMRVRRALFSWGVAYRGSADRQHVHAGVLCAQASAWRKAMCVHRSAHRHTCAVLTLCVFVWLCVCPCVSCARSVWLNRLPWSRSRSC